MKNFNSWIKKKKKTLAVTEQSENSITWDREERGKKA